MSRIPVYQKCAQPLVLYVYSAQNSHESACVVRIEPTKNISLSPPQRIEHYSTDAY